MHLFVTRQDGELRRQDDRADLIVTALDYYLPKFPVLEALFESFDPSKTTGK